MIFATTVGTAGYARWRREENTQCTGTAYTANTTDGCVGFLAADAAECRQRCVENNQAENCPRKTCGGATYDYTTNSCQLYESCDTTIASAGEARKAATTPQAVRVFRGRTRFSGPTSRGLDL